MYEHHKNSIQSLIDYFKNTDGVIAIILGGSVAKGIARTDSDLDIIVVVTDGKHMELSEAGRLSECITGYCTYPEGYYDIKYCTKEFLTSVSTKGSEPSRNAFNDSIVLYEKEHEISEIVSLISVFQRHEKEGKLLSFFSAFNLNYGYFWGTCENNSYLKTRLLQTLYYSG